MDFSETTEETLRVVEDLGISGYELKDAIEKGKATVTYFQELAHSKSVAIFEQAPIAIVEESAIVDVEDLIGGGDTDK